LYDNGGLTVTFVQIWHPLLHGICICSSYSLTEFLTMNLHKAGGVTSPEYLTSKVRTLTTSNIRPLYLSLHPTAFSCCAECSHAVWEYGLLL